MLNLFSLFVGSKEPKEKNRVGIRKFLSNPNKPLNITLESKDEICSIGSHEKRQILQAILDIYKIKAELKEPRTKKAKKKETEDVK